MGETWGEAPQVGFNRSLHVGVPRRQLNISGRELEVVTPQRGPHIGTSSGRLVNPPVRDVQTDVPESRGSRRGSVARRLRASGPSCVPPHPDQRERADDSKPPRGNPKRSILPDRPCSAHGTTSLARHPNGRSSEAAGATDVLYRTLLSERGPLRRGSVWSTWPSACPDAYESPVAESRASWK